MIFRDKSFTYFITYLIDFSCEKVNLTTLVLRKHLICLLFCMLIVDRIREF